MSRQLKRLKFSDLDLADPFFDSLKEGYDEFPNWFRRKCDDGVELYAVEDDEDKLTGMVYLKTEDGEVLDTTPPLPNRKWLKIGTLKIEGRGTKLGERVIKKILDTALDENADGVYVTVFDVHESLIELFTRYGFEHTANKSTKNGVEIVLTKDLRTMSGNTRKDYPFVKLGGARCWLLAVYPEYHSRLLPDSILNNEPRDILQDVSHTNTIHKVYLGKLPLTRMSPGDIIVIYRTTDGAAPAYYRSVVTSLCIVEEVRRKRDFASFDSFLAYVASGTVFSEAELREQWRDGERLYVAKLTYNVALGRRITRGTLLDDGIVSEQPRWDLRELQQAQLKRIISLGRVNERLIVD